MKEISKNIFVKTITYGDRYVCTEIVDLNEYKDNPIDIILGISSDVFYDKKGIVLRYILVNNENKKWQSELKENRSYCHIIFDEKYVIGIDSKIPENGSSLIVYDNEENFKGDSFNYFTEYKYNKAKFNYYAEFLEKNSGLNFKDKPLYILSSGEKCLLSLCKYLSGTDQFNFKNSLSSLSDMNLIIVLELLKLISFERKIEIKFFCNRYKNLCVRYLSFLISDKE